MPVKTIGIALGLIGVLAVAVYCLLGRNPQLAARHGSLLKRRLLTAGLTILGVLGVGTTPGCGEKPRVKPRPRVEPAAQVEAAAPIRNEMNLEGTRFGPPDLDTNKQPLAVEGRPPLPKPTTVETIFRVLKIPDRKRFERRTTCYIIRMPTGTPVLVTPALLLRRVAIVHALMANNALSERTLRKIWSDLVALSDELERKVKSDGDR